MKCYTKTFLKSELFYTDFYRSLNNNLTEYIIKNNLDRELGEHEVATKIVKQEYIIHCESYFKKDILFYENLSKYILNNDGTFKQLDEYIFFKLCFYAIKFLDISNECRNIFEEERKKFKENNYNEAIVKLSQFMFHDASVLFKYKTKILRITYNPGLYEEIFEFYGVERWNEKEFAKRNPILLIEELYEETPGNFVYNTLWYHDEVKGDNYSELSIKFTGLIQIK